MWHPALSSLEQHQPAHRLTQWLHLVRRTAENRSVITRVRTWVGGKWHRAATLFCDEIPFAPALICAANKALATPRSKLPLSAPLFFFTLPSHGCLLLSRLHSWSARLNSSFMLQLSLHTFPPRSLFYFKFSYILYIPIHFFPLKSAFYKVAQMFSQFLFSATLPLQLTLFSF